MTKRLALLATGLAAAASFSLPTSASAGTDAPCLVFGVWQCLGPTGEKVRDLLKEGS